MITEAEMQSILESLEASIAVLEKQKIDAGLQGCIDDCKEKNKECLAKAGSVWEKAKCRSDYNKCLTNC